MKKGEKAILRLKGEYAKHESIPGDKEEVRYEVELVDFVREKPSWEMTTEEKMAAALKAKEEGNELFKQGKYKRAIKKYKVRICWDFDRGLPNLRMRFEQKVGPLIDYDYSFSDEEKAQAKPLKVTAHLNTAACNLKLKDYKACIESCDKVHYLVQIRAFSTMRKLTFDDLLGAKTREYQR